MNDYKLMTVDSAGVSEPNKSKNKVKIIIKKK
jgi:hypothetical protein